MAQLIAVKALRGCKLRLTFDDGVAGDIDLTSRLFGPVFEPLRDPAFFAQVRLDEFGAPCWPNGADLAPDALYRTVKAHAKARASTAPAAARRRR